MNPLQQYPHLFCNGKFAIQYEGAVYRYNGYRPFGNQIELRGDRNIYPVIADCTLIARPIADMNDEECIKFFGWDQGGGTDMDRELISNFVSDDGNLDSESLLYLLSIGIYPFDQSHFSTGTVIDSTTISHKINQ